VVERAETCCVLRGVEEGREDRRMQAGDWKRRIACDRNVFVDAIFAVVATKIVVYK
jgi:hypothetical protein